MQPYASLYLYFKPFFSVIVLVGLAMSVLVNGIISELGSLLQSELGLLWSFKDDLKDMKTTLESVQSVLNDAEKRSFKEESVRLWLKRLKAAAYDIEDMLFDKFQFQKHSKFQVFKSYIVKSGFSIPVMAHKLKGMKKNLDKIAEERKNYSLREEAITHQEQVIKGRETCSSVTRADVLGREEEATEIINRLLMSTTEDICIIPIVGIGGLGKTTLAKLIYNDDRIKEAFELRIWVHAVDFKVEKLVEEILSSSRIENRNNLGNLEARMERVKEILKNKRYLIVLDDVWNDDWKKWEDFKPVLHGGERQSRIIVTTRNEGVGKNMRAEMPHKLKPLSYDVCLKLFERMAFGSAGAKDNNLASIGKEIVKKCQGVPLTANSLGGMLFGKGEATWKNVKDSDLWKVVEGEEGSSSENNIIFSLNLSYQLMPSALKLCFTYCSSYPKAFKLDKDMLIQQWIAQRFIQTKDEIEAVEIGDRYVNYLLSISFLEKEKDYDDEEEQEMFKWRDVKSYMKMHDLVYDLARWVAGGEVSVSDPLESGKDNAMEYRYASVIKSNGASKELGKALPRKVRALHFQDCTSLPKGIFSYTKCLRVLDFTNCSLVELPTSIYRLKQLRYLRLPHDLKEVDERIGKLGTLERLIISGCRAIHILPTSIGKLYNLIYLEINDCNSLSKIPNSIGSLQRLNSLKLASCPDLTSLPEFLGYLVNLVQIELKNISNCEHLPVLGQLPKLEEIFIERMPKVRRVSEEGFCRARNTTAGVASFPSLKRLEIGYMDELERWVYDGETGASLFPCLEDLTIRLCRQLRKIHRCILPSLKRLKLEHLWQLEGWVTTAVPGDDGERGASLFPCLEELTIHDCNRLRRIRPCIPPSVRRLSLLDKDLHLLTFPEMPLLKHLDILFTGLYLSESIQTALKCLTSLESLELRECASLTTFPEWLGELSQLQYLKIENCELIDRLPQSIQGLTALKRLCITECSKSLWERTRKETGEDWDKISHIDKVEITRGDYDSVSSEEDWNSSEAADSFLSCSFDLND